MSQLRGETLSHGTKFGRPVMSLGMAASRRPIRCSRCLPSCLRGTLQSSKWVFPLGRLSAGSSRKSQAWRPAGGTRVLWVHNDGSMGGCSRSARTSDGGRIRACRASPTSRHRHRAWSGGGDAHLYVETRATTTRSDGTALSAARTDLPRHVRENPARYGLRDHHFELSDGRHDVEALPATLGLATPDRNPRSENPVYLAPASLRNGAAVARGSWRRC
jgi:hypothetical protein